jgi:hypothetical protein
MGHEAKLYTLLYSDSGVSSLVSSRIYPCVAPQDAPLPYIVYQRVTSGRVYDLDGYAHLENVRMQIDCYAETSVEAWNIADAVADAMRGSGSFSVGGDDPMEMSEDGAFRVSCDYSIWDNND